MNKELIRLIQNMLIENEPMLKKYISYFKKAGTNSFNGAEISPELRTIMLDDIAKDIQRKDYGHYQLTVSDHPKKYHEDREKYLTINDYNPEYIEKRLKSLENRYNNLKAEKEAIAPLPRRDDDLEHFSNYYQMQGDELLKATNNPEDLSLLSENMNRKEDSLIDDIIKNQEDLENSKIVIPHYISDKEEITNALENLLIQKQQSRMYDQYKANQMANEQPEFPVKQITGKELDYYRMLKDKPELYTKEDTKIYKDESDRLLERLNKWFPDGVGKELDFFRNRIKEKNLNIDEDLADYLEILNTGRFLKDFE